MKSGARAGKYAISAATAVLAALLVFSPGQARADSVAFGFGTHGGGYLSFSFGSPYGYRGYDARHRHFHYDQARRHHGAHHALDDAHDAYHYWEGHRDSFQHRRFHRELRREHRAVHRSLRADHGDYHWYWGY